MKLLSFLRLPAVSGLVLMGGVVSVAWVSISSHLSLSRIDAITQTTLDPASHAEHLLAQKGVRFPNEWVATAQALAGGDAEDLQTAIALLDRALIDAPHNAQAWSLLAFLHRQTSGSYNEQADRALLNSFNACAYCSKSLLRWRFTFVLNNWNATNEEVRLHAFSGADFLRWWHLDYDYLEQVRQDALARDIPYDAYRKKIATPVRPNEIGLDGD
ncbi:MAG: hypothetical protein AAFV59_16230 [Pseudomonadota bacterium]